MAAMTPPHRYAPWRQSARWLGPALVPIAFVLVASWQRRWLCDDAFINFRVIRQIGEGNGAVFNAGERVEVATSPAWLALVGLVHAISRVRLEWVTVALGLLCTAAAMVVASWGARLLHGSSEDHSEDNTWWLPLGLLCFGAVPVVWDYTTGGLENPLSWLWWASTFALSVRATVGTNRGSTTAAVVCAGLGPLVRPDLGVVSAVFIVTVIYSATAEISSLKDRLRQSVSLLGLAVIAPATFQVFRMGYYGQLLPNTVYAKGGSSSWWSQGGRYLYDLVGTYSLWIPAVVVATGALASFVSAPVITGRRRIVLASLLAAVVHAALVTRAGGDYMHGRLLLPALFGLLLPVVAVPLNGVVLSRLGTVGAALAIVGWFVAIAGNASVGQLQDGIHDERRGTVGATSHANPVTVESHLGYLDKYGIDLTKWGKNRPPTWRLGLFDRTALPRASNEQPALSFGAMGAVPFQLPTNVYVADQLGLADVVTARVRLEHRGVPGHEKYLGLSWWSPRLLPDEVVVPPGLDSPPILVVSPGPKPSQDPVDIAKDRADADAALECGALGALRSATTEPLGPRRFSKNLVGAFGLHTFDFNRDPAKARNELCG